MNIIHRNLLKYLLPLPVLALVGTGSSSGRVRETGSQGIAEKTVLEVIRELSKKYPVSEKARLDTGVRQAARLWTKEDGAPEEFKFFCRSHFYAGKDLEVLLARFESKLEQMNGHFTALQMELKRELDEDRGNLYPFDEMFAAYTPGAHLVEDLFHTKLAFIVLLNFPVRTLEECLTQGSNWTREQWAQARLARLAAYRVPARVEQEVAGAYTRADSYIYNYNIYMDHVVDDANRPLFKDGLKLISHWGLRDELKALYSNAAENLGRQKVIYDIMERIISQQIPQKAVNSREHLWNPERNTLDGKTSPREPDTRYQHWLDIFHAHRLEDPYYPALGTHIDRSFKLGREMTETEMENLLKSVLSADVGKEVAQVIEKRLGRKLLPFDIWYDGFKTRSTLSGGKLDKIVAEKYPNVEAFQKNLPDILEKLGFDGKTAEYVASKIEVNPARGAGHALGAEMRTEKAHLRTRVPKGGMDYQGFNIAMHEFGHCVEQTFSLYGMDHTLLSGVPNTAFTEGFAFIFQNRDLDVLGLGRADAKTVAMNHLDTFWATREIAGVALVDMRAWRWMYQHPQATPAQLRGAVIRIAKEVWNEYYAPLLGVRNDPLLAVYSHMIDSGLYIPDYPLGHIIAFQVEDYFKTRSLGREMERMCRLGNLTPTEWMRQAVGAPISTEPLIQAAQASLKVLNR